MKAIAVIQARMSSSRLPGKVLMPLGGKPVLAWIVNAAHAIVGIDEVVIATSVEHSDDPIASWCGINRQLCFRGSLHNVLSRYAAVAQECKADIVMRLTADCPLLDPAVCSNILALLRNKGCDYATNIIPRSWPVGLDCEVFTASALFLAKKSAQTDYQKEHVTPYIQENPQLFTICNLPCPIPALEKHRWTLDTQEDYAFLNKLASHLNGNFPPDYNTVLRMMHEHPELLAHRT